jgi:ferric-dicitrate binding protein FerR (iron transport regulator)
MTSENCPRAWEAEAVEDGRLTGSDRVAFERHATTCEVCTRERAALALLGAAARQVGTYAPSALGLRRARMELLRVASERASRRFSPPGLRRASKRVLVAVAVACACACLALFGARLHHHPPSVASLRPQAVPSPQFDTVDLGGAILVRRTAGGLETVTELRDGAAGFHVDRVPGGGRFLLLLPDGELEVRGTRFVVRVSGGRTRSVEVSEGLVALRLHGQSERLIGMGERWSSSPEGPPESSPTAVDPPSPVSPPPRALASPPKAEAPSRVQSRPAATHQGLFGEAVAAYAEGDLARADVLLSSYADRCPGNDRCEDVAFLRAMARARMGDTAGAASLAKAYLQAYPSGLRRPEAQRLAAMR